MFERFTDRARRVVVLAQEEARVLGHGFIGTEHILAGLVDEGEGVAALVLVEFGIDPGFVRTEIETIIGARNDSPTGHIPFTPRCKKVLELSLREALQLGHNYIGTEHILLGMIRESEGVGCQIITRHGQVDLARVRQAVIKKLSGYATTEPTLPEIAYVTIDGNQMRISADIAPARQQLLISDARCWKVRLVAEAEMVFERPEPPAFIEVPIEREEPA